MEAYFDNSATTVVLPQVAELVNHIMTVDYGNPSSMHLKGVQAEKYIRQAREDIAKTLHCKDKEIIFTSGSTEGMNIITQGFFKRMLDPGDEVLITNSEHASIVLPWFVLENDQKIKVNFIDLDETLHVTLAKIKESITPKTKVIFSISIEM